MEVPQACIAGPTAPGAVGRVQPVLPQQAQQWLPPCLVPAACFSFQLLQDLCWHAGAEGMPADTDGSLT